MRTARLVTTSTTITVLLSALAMPAIAQNRAPTVLQQFDDLKHRGNPMGVHVGPGLRQPLVAVCKHYQSVMRYDGINGQAYMIFCRSGNKTGSCEQLRNKPGELLFVRMASRDLNSTRLRSNRLSRADNTDTTIPNLGDRGFIAWFFDGTNNLLGMSGDAGHPGGMTIVDDVLIVPVTIHYDSEDNKTSVVFIDIRNPESPRHLKTLLVDEHAGWASSFMSDGRAYVLLGGMDRDGRMSVLRMNTNNLRDPALAIARTTGWHKTELPEQDRHQWPEGSGEYQNVAVVTQTDGSQFLIGMTDDDASPLYGTNNAWIFNLSVDGNDNLSLGFLRQRNFRRDSREQGDYADFRAGAGIFVDHEGNLHMYGCEYRAAGPGDTIRMAEYSNEWLNTSRTISGPCAPAWLELYSELAGWDDYDSRSAIFDQSDAFLESWDNMHSKLDDAGDMAKSAVWAAPAGSFFVLYEHDGYRGASIRLDGTGRVEAMPGLGDLTGEVSSVRYFAQSPGYRRISNRGDPWQEQVNTMNGGICAIAGFTGDPDRQVEYEGGIFIDIQVKLTIHDGIGTVLLGAP